MATLEKIIRENGGKARIFTTVDIMGKGIHYTRIGDSYPTFLPKLGLDIRSHVDIDLEDANSQALLRKLVKLTLSFSYSPSGGYRRFGFVVNSLSTNKPICLLNGDRFLDINEIYSLDFTINKDNIIYDNMDISEFFGVFDIKGKNNEWQKYNAYFPYDLSKEHLDLF